ncbi:MAG TPA: glycosyltransferase family 87 protein [Terracidiphilus sp.]|nr:glycosyltransferase family 87 protein [Terracidiphilus sp.]
MRKDRLDGLQIVLFGGVLVFAISALLALINHQGMSDFRQFYYASRCLVEHHDPYQESQIWAVYAAEVQNMPTDAKTVKWLHEILLYPNLPTTLVFMVPLAMLPWNAAVAAWMALIVAGFFVAGYLVWRFSSDVGPRFAAALVFLIFVNSVDGLSIGNTAALVVGLCVIAVWCFVSEKFAWAGIICLAVGLAIKPHDAGIIWLYFLLAGGLARKRALQTLAVTALLALIAVVWVSSAVPHWPQELSANLHTITAPGAQDDPGPQSGGALGLMMMVNLQVLFSRVGDNPAFYNLATYLFCGAALVLWALKTLRTRYSPMLAWYGLAAGFPFAMLAVYHRCYDCRLLLVAVPVCVDLWQSRSPLRWGALAVTLAGITLTGDLLWIVIFQITRYSTPSMAAAVYAPPIAMAVVGVFFLWVYLKAAPAGNAEISLPQ